MERDRFNHSFDHSDDISSARLQRVEVITGERRRRDWPTKRKLEIIAESLVEGEVVSDVARRHGISPQQLFGWRTKFRAAVAAIKQKNEGPGFAPVVVETAAPSTPRPLPEPVPAITEAPPVIEISIGPASVRVRGAVDAKALGAVLKALKVLA